MTGEAESKAAGMFAAFDAKFLSFIALATLVAVVAQPYPNVAMWVGFCFAAYAAVANDSIQTIGTFIASNRGRPWWHLWLFMGGLMAVTLSYSWATYGGDVSYERLTSKGFENAPTEFTVLQLIAPLVLLILTRLRMPVSTTFLLLSCFAAEGKSIGAVLLKSISGYGIAFLAAILLWFTVTKLMERVLKGEPHPLWRPVQWVTSGVLWSVWLMQDAANVAVYLPRQMTLFELLGVLVVMVGGLGWLFATGGERIQEVVDEKSSVQDVRSATIIDFLYAGILYLFKIEGNVPMSTTWVFIGLLAGRELAISIRSSDKSLGAASRMVARDLIYVTAGFLVSLVLAFFGNPALQSSMLGE